MYIYINVYVYIYVWMYIDTHTHTFVSWEYSEVSVCLATRRVINIYKWEPFRFNLLN